MIESAGKAYARRIFFVCLQHWFTQDQLQSGNILLLLGKDARELVHTDSLEIPREHITCIESDLDIYHYLIHQDHGVRLQCAPVRLFLEQSLCGHTKYLAMSLDIEGQYRTHIEPAMTGVMLYCCRNPNTVVATYSTLTRDMHTIWESIVSLAIMLMIAPNDTERLLQQLTSMYRKAGHTTPEKFAIRDLFWVRSIFEHNLAIASILGDNGSGNEDTYFAICDQLWKHLCTKPYRKLTLGKIRKDVKEFVQKHNLTREYWNTYTPLWITIQEQKNMLYKAKSPWIQRCYFTKFGISDDPFTIPKWISKSADAFLESGIVFVSDNGTPSLICADPPKEAPVTNKVMIEDKFKKLQVYTPRKISKLSQGRLFSALQKMHMSMTRKEQEMSKSASPLQSGEQLIRCGEFTRAGKLKIRELAAMGFNTSEITSMISRRDSEVPQKSIRAFVARARRPHLFVIGASKTLSDHAKGFICSLAKSGKTLDEVNKRLPKGLSQKAVLREFNQAKKG